MKPATLNFNRRRFFALSLCTLIGAALAGCALSDSGPPGDVVCTRGNQKVSIKFGKKTAEVTLQQLFRVRRLNPRKTVSSIGMELQVPLEHCGYRHRWSNLIECDMSSALREHFADYDADAQISPSVSRVGELRTYCLEGGVWMNFDRTRLYCNKPCSHISRDGKIFLWIFGFILGLPLLAMLVGIVKHFRTDLLRLYAEENERAGSHPEARSWYRGLSANERARIQAKREPVLGIPFAKFCLLILGTAIPFWFISISLIVWGEIYSLVGIGDPKTTGEYFEFILFSGIFALFPSFMIVLAYTLARPRDKRTYGSIQKSIAEGFRDAD